IPALLNVLKSDASIEVQLSAAVSLAGFGSAGKSATPVIVERIDSFDGQQHFDNSLMQFILLKSLSDIDSSAGQFRKNVGKTLDRFKRSGDTKHWLMPTCRVLEVLQSDGKWAIPQLIDAADSALARDDELSFMQISAAIVSVGSND